MSRNSGVFDSHELPLHQKPFFLALQDDIEHEELPWCYDTPLVDNETVLPALSLFQREFVQENGG